MENYLRPVLSSFFLLMALCLFSNCQTPSMEVQFIENKEGLRPEHLDEVPLLETEYCFPGRECEVSRLYNDGGYYFYRPPQGWFYLTQVKPSGTGQLKEIFNKYCELDEETVKDDGADGTYSYRWHTSKCGKEVMVFGRRFGGYADLMNVNTIINSNLIPVTQSPRQ